MKNFNDWKYDRLHNRLAKNAEIIEKTLDSFGLKTRVTEINEEKNYIEYCLEVVIGLNLDELEKHSRDLALALASPTGKVKMIIPIPGRSLVGIQVPKPTQEQLEKIRKRDEERDKHNSTLINTIGNFFLFIGYVFVVAGKKINNK